MRTFDFYSTACFDPVTLTTLAMTAGGMAMSLFNKPSAAKMPAAAPPVQQPNAPTQDQGQGSGQPSFLAAAASPSAMQLGSKRLLGQ